MKVYVALSWRNAIQPAVVMALRMAGHEVYDFRHPAPGNGGFQWSAIDPNWQEWTPDAYLAGLEHPAAEEGFGLDMAGLNGADVTVLVLPCGRSAHLEAGYAAGQDKPVIILIDPTFEPELMYKMSRRICTTIDQVIETLGELERSKQDVG